MCVILKCQFQSVYRFYCFILFTSNNDKCCWLRQPCHSLALFKTLLLSHLPQLSFQSLHTKVVEFNLKCDQRNPSQHPHFIEFLGFFNNKIGLICTSLLLFRATIDRISSDTNGWNDNLEISFRHPKASVLEYWVSGLGNC